MIEPCAKSQWDCEGYVVAKGLFSPDEAARFRDHYMTIHAQGSGSGYDVPADATSADPLRRFPRIMQPHRWDGLSMGYLLDPRLRNAMTALVGIEPLAVQTMVYFKPPGARGQALHQDQYYLRVKPGTCIAAWMALDRCDDENGGMRLVPGSHQLPVLCTVEADLETSFTDVTVPVPPGMDVVTPHMEAGDVLFFNGQLIHGSGPNNSPDRFRRALIAHYIAGDAKTVSRWYKPVYRFDGTVVEIGGSEEGGPCGVFRENGSLEMVAAAGAAPTERH